MKLISLSLCNFQSFGEGPTELVFDPTTFLIGPNGSGKTAVLQALARMFGFDQGLRKIRRGDFHVQADLQGPEVRAERLWIQAEFGLPELKDKTKKHSTVPGNFAHMRLESNDGVPVVRIRLEATIDANDEIDENIFYVLTVDPAGEPKKTTAMARHDRSAIQVHYLPARRDPGDHISYSTSALLGRILRAASWENEAETISKLSQEMSASLKQSGATQDLDQCLSDVWATLHRGAFYANPSLSFATDEIESVLKFLTVAFSPAHGEPHVDFMRLGDGQKSLLYITLVLAAQKIGRKVLDGTFKLWDVNKLRPAVFSLVAIEEPENSLSPHYLGRVLSKLTLFSEASDAQAVIATHAPALLRRVAPERIRYLRLDEARQTIISSIKLPQPSSVAHKFVREAVISYPELYFFRLVILGEGDTEQIIIPRLLQATGHAEDSSSVLVVPLGGRHVNHLWRLLAALRIPYVTLLDLDLARNGGGWGRISYALNQLKKIDPKQHAKVMKDINPALPEWDDQSETLLGSERGKKLLSRLEEAGVFFSAPLDLDFSMLMCFQGAYRVKASKKALPKAKTLASVLGAKHGDEGQYHEDLQRLFVPYQRRFKNGSKPAEHLEALSSLDDAALVQAMPKSLRRLLDLVQKKLQGLPE